MYKPRLGILFILVCLATSITFAGSYFTNNNSPAPAMPKQPANPAMAPDAFTSLSHQQQQQTQSNMSKQVTTNMAASPYPAPGSPPAPAQQQQKQQHQQTDNSGNDNSGATTQDPSQSPQPYSGTAAPSSTGNRSNGGSSQQGLGIKY
jgi:hypothetical protein